MERGGGICDDLVGAGWTVVSLTDLRSDLNADLRTFLENLNTRFLKIARNASRANGGDAIDLDGIYSGRAARPAGQDLAERALFRRGTRRDPAGEAGFLYLWRRVLAAGIRFGGL
jgi:hypothetical protein